MELKIGDYIRTNDGIITKVSMKIEDMIYFDDVVKTYFNDSYRHLYESELNDYIFKSSPNIIDLIECDDYVNGYMVTKVNKLNGYGTKETVEVINGEVYLTARTIEKEQIKSICTKENFERVSYNVGV